MSTPPKPSTTNPDEHAPGVSKTLEEGAARSRELQDSEKKEADQTREPKDRKS